jgi:hypothetical protein
MSPDRRRPDRTAPSRPAAAATRARSTSAEPSSERGAIALWIGLAALAAVRCALAFSPGMWMWGLNHQRFLDPLLSWLPWGLAALPLLPPLARRLEPATTRLGDGLARGSWPVTLTLVLLLVALLWGSPDNTLFVGDFLLRRGTVEMAGKPSVLFPQALPLDVFIHVTVPAALQNTHLLTGSGTSRLIGLLDGGLLALFAALLVRALGLTGAPALGAWAVATFGSYLGMFTGYSKSLAEMVTLCVAVAAFGVRLARSGRGALGLGATLAVGFALHRSALAFAVPAAVGWWIAARRAGAVIWRRPATWIALGLPALALAISLPKIISTLVHVDVAVHLVPTEAKRAGILGAAFSSERALEMANLVLLLSPLVLIAALAALVGRTRRAASAGAIAPPLARGESAAPPGRGAAAAVLLALALPMLVGAPFVHPAQGLFRDWDDFAALGAALSMVAAWLVGACLSAARAWRWVAVSVAFGVVMPAIQWLALNNDVDQGLARARAFVTEPPPRTDLERAGVWDYLGIRNYQLERWVASTEAFSHAAASAPSPRMLEEWATAATRAGQLELAQSIYHRLVEKDPKNLSAWLGLGAVTSRIPDVDDSFWATRKLLELDPHDAGGLRLMEYLKQTYPNHP